LAIHFVCSTGSAKSFNLSSAIAASAVIGTSTTTFLEIDAEAIDALSYNGCGEDAGYDGHRFFNCVTKVGKFVVMRIGICTYFREKNPNAYLFDEDGEPILDAEGEWQENPEYEDYEPEYNRFECVQLWFCPNGQIVQLSADRSKPLRWIDVSCCFAESELKLSKADMTWVLNEYDNCYCDSNYMRWFCDKNNRCKAMKEVHKFIEAEKFGIDTFYEDKRDEQRACLVAWGYGDMFCNKRGENFYNHLFVSEFWQQIKIAHRNHIDLHKYDQEKLKKLWWLMEDENGNLQNVNDFCPKDIDNQIKIFELRQENRLENERRERELMRVEAEERAKMSNEEFVASANTRYAIRKKCFLGIRFDTDTMEFEVLKDVNDFYEVGKDQGHCVFNSAYYEMPTAIVLTCRDKTDRHIISTITVDVAEMRITSNLGKKNSIPKNARDIQDLVMMQMPVFHNAFEAQKRIDKENGYVATERSCMRQRAERRVNLQLGNGVDEVRMEKQRAEILKQFNIAM